MRKFALSAMLLFILAISGMLLLSIPDSEAQISGGSIALPSLITLVPLSSLVDCDDTGGNHLNYDSLINEFSCGTSSSGATTGTFTITWSQGCSNDPTSTATWNKSGNIVTLRLQNSDVTCTSDATFFASNADLPVGIRPAAAVRSRGQIALNISGTETLMCVEIGSAGAISMFTSVPACNGAPGNVAKILTSGIQGVVTYQIN